MQLHFLPIYGWHRDRDLDLRHGLRESELEDRATKGGCSPPPFVRAVLIELAWLLRGTIYDSRRGRPGFEPYLGQTAVT